MAKALAGSGETVEFARLARRVMGPLPRGESGKFDRLSNIFLLGFPDYLAGRFACKNQVGPREYTVGPCNPGGA